MLTHENLLQIFDYSDGHLIWKSKRGCRIKAGDIAGCKHYSGYIQITINKKSYRAHRLVFFWHHGYMPEFIDHIDRNRSNNKIQNLRPATKLQNQGNRAATKNNLIGLKGIYWDKTRLKWGARIGIKGQCKRLGYFESTEKAYAAYSEAAKKHFGEYAYL